VAAAGGAGDVDPVLLPLIADRLLAIGAHAERGVVAGHDRLVGRLVGDGGRSRILQLGNLAAAVRPVKVVDRAVGAHGDVDRAGDACGERADGDVVVGVVELPQPAAAVVGEEVVAP